MGLNVKKTKIISFTPTDQQCSFKLVNGVLILHTDCGCIRHLYVTLDSKLHFHHLVDYVCSQALSILWLVRFITYILSSLDSLIV